MDELVKLLVDNGVSVVCVGAFLYYVFKQQTQNEKIVEVIQEISTNLALINEKLGIKVENIKKNKEK